MARSSATVRAKMRPTDPLGLGAAEEFSCEVGEVFRRMFSMYVRDPKFRGLSENDLVEMAGFIAQEAVVAMAMERGIIIGANGELPR